MRRLTLTLLLVLWSHLACAESFEYRIVNGPPYAQTTGWAGSKEAACNALRDLNQAADPSNAITAWQVIGTEPGCSLRRIVASTGEDLGTQAASYEQRGVSPCVAGEHSTLNVTTGWARTSTLNASDIVVDFWKDAASISASRCDGQCTQSFGSIRSCDRSQIPASNGLHRLSCDLDVVATGAQCSTRATDADPTQPPSPCPGYVGEVNGKKVCVGTGNTPLPQTPKPAGTPPDQPGNPSAGPKPTTGPGSGSDGPGRTPLVGDGGNAGGGSSAATPGGGSEGNGQVSTPGTGGGGTGGGTEINVETCGLPGKPPCKLDETGTPDGHGSFDGANASLESAKTASVGAVTSAGSQVTGLAWLWGFALPSGTCTVLTTHTRLGDLSIDVCNSPAVALWRSVAGYMLFILGALYIWRSATSSTPGGK